MINKSINKLINYGIRNNFLEEDDIPYAVNRILKILDLNSFVPETIEENELDLSAIIKEIENFAIENKVLLSQTLNSKDAFEAQIIDCMLPRPSELNRIFYKNYKTGPLTATKWFHDFSIKTNYIKIDRISKNLKFKYEGKYSPLDITINLSKPEKDPLDIINNKNNNNDYPMCPLCIENVGVYQTPSLAPRSNHRVINLTLNHEKDKWGMQYSPYAYFDEHLIVLRKDHSPMYVNQKTFAELVDFINKFPHYLIGSNAGLPIVGGSILNHHHFQGGKYDFPIEKAQVIHKIKRKRMMIEVLDWPLAAIRIVGNNENSILDMANAIFEYWLKYENKDLNILAQTDVDHNTVTPIVKLDGASYNFYMIFRNNLTTPEFPLGVFHPNPKRFHIKKENIGLIEAMGMAILPGRLLKEVEMIKEVLLNKKNIDDFPELDKHKEWIYVLKTQSLDDLDNLLNNEVGRIFEEVLEDCNVFKYGTKQDFINFVNKAIY